MTLSAGTRLGPYEIAGPIGAGGMGEVYRARDTRLGRDVAVKVLLTGASHTAERLHRFEQEARLAGSLNHPNVLTLLDVGSHEGAPYLVTELLEGRTLREALAAGPLPSRKAIDYGQQVARGLAAAHEQGVVHRDLKPANLFVTKDGRVKILDFGLAKLTQPDPEAGGSQFSTDSADGHVVGTLGYMAPEQVRGQSVDARTDIFAFGAVVYEMLSGRRAFVGDTPADTMTAILTKDPEELSRPGLDVPGGLERIVHRCLEKDPAERFQSAKDVAFALEAESGSSRSAVDAKAPPIAKRRRWLSVVAVPAATLLVGATAGLLARWRPADPAPKRATFVDVALPPGVQLVEPTFARLSDDGRQLVFVGLDKGGRRLWWRSLDSATTRALPGTEGGWPVAWSRDGRRVVFNTSAIVLKAVDVRTGVVATIGPLPKGDYWGDATGTWDAAGDLVLNWGSLLLFPAAGGAPSVLAPKAADGSTYFDAPQFLPDGRHYLAGVVASTLETSGVCVSESGAAGCRFVLRSVSWATFSPRGQLLFLRDGALFAQRFDPDRLALSGEPARLTDGVYVSTWRHPTAWVGGDTLAFVGGAPLRYQFTWFDRSGRESGRLGSPAEAVGFDLTPDGNRVVMPVGDPGGLELRDARRGSSARLTGSKGGGDPRFSADGQSILFNRNGLVRGLFRLQLDSGAETPVLRPDLSSATAGSAATFYFLSDWSRDGRTALFTPGDPNRIWSVPVSGSEAPRLVVKSAGTVDQAAFSPDGRWIAYNADENGQNDVFVVPFPPTGERWQVSTNGGVQPLWRADGREIFYLDPEGTLMVASVAAARAFAAGPPRALFRTPLVNPSSMIEDYRVTGDGQRFLLRLPAADSRPPELKLVLDWPALLDQTKQGSASRN